MVLTCGGEKMEKPGRIMWDLAYLMMVLDAIAYLILRDKESAILGLCSTAVIMIIGNRLIDDSKKQG